MKNLATLMGIVALLLCACSKEDKKMLITGKIITDCKGTPLANYSLRLSVVYSTWSSPKNIEYFPFTRSKAEITLSIFLIIILSYLLVKISCDISTNYTINPYSVNPQNVFSFFS